LFFKKGRGIIKEVQSEYWKIWIAEKDFKTCVACRILDGKIFGIDLLFPEPPLHPNCRCRTEIMQAILKKDADYHIDAIIAAGRNVYNNAAGKLPDAPWRIWYEADTVNIDGNVGAERILYSSDGLVFITRDDYKSFIEVGRSADVMDYRPGEYTGDWNSLTQHEKKVAEDLIWQGKTVESIPRDPNDPTPDFYVDGVKTEVKNLENANTNTGMKRVQEGFDKQGAETVIIDARNSGLTEAQAYEILARAAGTYPEKTIPGKVEIWLDCQIVNYP